MGKGRKINGLESLDKGNFSHGVETDSGGGGFSGDNQGEVGNKYPVSRAGKPHTWGWVGSGSGYTTPDHTDYGTQYNAVSARVSHDLHTPCMITRGKPAGKRTE